MSRETIINGDKVSLYCYPEEGIVHHVINQFVYGDTLRNLMMKGADIFEKEDCNKWLSNDQSSSALKQEDLEWLQENWEDRILDAGWDYWAVVMPESVTGKMERQRIVERYEEKGVEVNPVENEEEGLNWLLDQ